MGNGKSVAGAALCVGLAWGQFVLAEAPPVPAFTKDSSLRPIYLVDEPMVSMTRPTTSPATQPSETQPATTPPTRPLMAGLERVGVGKPLEDAGISVGGYVEGGYTGSTRHAPANFLAGRVFDTRNEHVVLDQANFFFDRPVDYAKAAANHTIDVGAHLDLIYGWDAGLVHSNGLFDNPATPGVSKGFYRARNSSENQFDVNQAYIDLALPIGTGLRLRAGKFVTLFGEEVINPTGDAFYSHTYLFGFAIPFTHTGILGEYKLSDDWLIDAGITRGWNQSINDNNGEADFLGGVTYTPQGSDFLKKWKLIANLSVGPQATHDNHDWWTVVDFQAYYAATDKLNFSINADYGDAPLALAPKSAQWFGAAGYCSFVLNDYLTLNGRAEWYDDNNGFTLGVPGNLNIYEGTLRRQAIL